MNDRPCKWPHRTEHFLVQKHRSLAYVKYAQMEQQGLKMADMCLDHVKPLHKCPRSTVDAFLTCLNWRNLQPLSTITNNSKGCQFDENARHAWEGREVRLSWCFLQQAQSQRASAFHQHQATAPVALADSDLDGET